MGNLAGALAGLLVPALFVAGLVATPAIAQEKGKDAKPAAAKKGEPTIKVHYEDDKVRIFDVTFKPGDAGANVERPKRVLRAVRGGTLTLLYPDGKKGKLAIKTGEVLVRDPTPAYIPKNEGKSDIVLYNVFFKDAKK